MGFEEIWKKIENHAGEEFLTISGRPFTFVIDEGYLITSRSKYKLAKSNFEVAAKIKDLKGPGQINQLVRGPAYVYAILTDDRIRP